MKKTHTAQIVFAIFIFSCFTIFSQSGLNNSVLTDGGNTYLNIIDSGPADASANTDAYKITGTTISLEAWVYPVYFSSGNNTIIERALSVEADPYYSYSLSVSSTGGMPQAYFGISDGTSGSSVIVADPDQLPKFQWTHIAGTYDGTFLRIYVNGELKDQVASSVSLIGNGYGLFIGRSRYGNGFYGMIDDARLWNVTRSQSDISENMMNELTGSEAGLAGYWKMNDLISVGYSLVVKDETNNHNELVTNIPPIAELSPTTPGGIPAFTFSPASLDFGITEQRTAVSRTLSFTNTSSYPLVGVISSQSNDIGMGARVFYAAANSASNLTFAITPLAGGDISGNIITEANDGSLNLLPFTISSISLQRIDANNIGMWLRRDGRFALNPITTLPGGFEWPINSGKTAIYTSGIWIGAQVSGETRTAAASYNTEFSPGPEIGGAPADPNNTEYRVFKINAEDNASTNPDYAEWPANLGAPVNADGTPKVIGDQTLFNVYNDLNAELHNYVFYSAPLGAEVQQTTFGFNSPGALANTVFLRFKIINKSSDTWNNTYVSLWSDPDLGYAYDDLVGIDVDRNMGFVYNGSANDAVYGSQPPALGYKILKGAFFTKPIQAFANYINGGTYPHRDPGNAQEAYNYMQGLLQDGSPYLDPITSQPTVFSLNGDPVTGSGSIDSNPGDRRFLFSTGPLTMEPGQSKEMIAAIIVGQGTDYLNSITALRSEADEIQNLFDGGYIFGGALENIASSSALPNTEGTLDDISNSSTVIDFNSGETGATVEIGTYTGPPPGALDITSPTIAGVGKYLEIQTGGTIEWPVNLRVYYTANDLNQAGVSEGDLDGLYYWDDVNNIWNIYSNSGDEDQGRGVSTTSVNTTNVTINGIEYEGYVSTVAYHVAPIIIGATVKNISQQYDALISFINSLHKSDFKKPGEQTRRNLVDLIEHSEDKYERGKLKQAYKILEESVLNHLTVKQKDNGKKKDGKDNGKSNKKNDSKNDKDKKNADNQLWVTDNTAREAIITMVENIISNLKNPPMNKQMMSADQKQLLKAPPEYFLSQNYPNPFNPSTTFRFGIAQGGQVTLKIFNTLGQEVAVLINREMPAGTYEINWNASGLPSGMYIYKLQSDKYSQTAKLILLK